MEKQLKDLNILVKKDLTWILKMEPVKKYWVVFLFLCLAGIGVFFVISSFKLATRTTTITVTGRSHQPTEQPPLESVFSKKPKGESPQKIQSSKNILLAGIPGEGNSAPNLTDTLMLAHLKANGEIFLFSIPRDLLVIPPKLNYYTKINSIFSWYLKNKGKKEAAAFLTQKISEITGVQIDNFLIIDLSTLKDIVNFVGGVNVNPSENIYDSCFPGPDNSCQTFYLRAGKHNLSGEMAIKYVRTRHSTYGDFDRIKRQQEVIIAIKDKMSKQNLFSSLAFFIQTARLFFEKTVTDLSLIDTWKIWQTVKETDQASIHRFTISDKPNNALLESGQFQFGNGQIGYVLKPKAGLENYSEIQAFISGIIE